MTLGRDEEPGWVGSGRGRGRGHYLLLAASVRSSSLVGIRDTSFVLDSESDGDGLLVEY